MPTKSLLSLTDEFNKESEYAAIKFANAVKEPNLFCDINMYDIWKSFMREEKQSRETSLQKNENIDLKSTDKFEEKIGVNNISLNITAEKELQKVTYEDVTASLKEHFESVDCIPLELFKKLLHPQETIAKLFTNLSEVLNSEQILALGESIENHLDDFIMEYFCRCLLLKMTTVFIEDLKLLFLRLCNKSYSIVIPQIVSTIESNDELDILVLYFTSMESTLQERLLNEIRMIHTNFIGKYLLVASCLVNKDMEYNSLKKLVEIMANYVDHYATDKHYGKLLFRVIKYLGRNLTPMESILRPTVNSHKSIWRAKIQKTLNDHLETSILPIESEEIQ